ncbi:MAG: hypothetical protein L6435_17295 [Anaerolineae bacterium]|nr:hypothetical protein [Anaerolineae bacterium]
MMKRTASTRLYVVLALAFGLAIGSSSPSLGQLPLANETPNVLIDLSHEYTFAFDWDLSWRYLGPAGYDYTRFMATLERASLNAYDALVIGQYGTGVAFPVELRNAIRDFVSAGGGLLLIGKGWVWDTYYGGFPFASSYPLNDLATVFGAQFITNAYAVQPYSIRPHETTAEVTTLETKGCVGGILALDANWVPLVTDSTGQPLMAVRQFGSGRIFLSAEDCILANPPINLTFILNVVSWLTDGQQTRYPGTTPEQRVEPELMQIMPHVTVRYAASLGDRFQFVQDNFPTIYNNLKSMTAVEPVYDLRILCLATGGGGYSGGQEIGVGILTVDHSVIGVLTHEMAHSWNEPGGFPGAALEEGWASLMAIRVQDQMGCHSEAAAHRAVFEAQFRRLDPTGTELDLNADATGIPLGDLQAYMGKAMWVFETLEGNYGADFFSRLMPLHRQWVQSGQASNPVTMGDFIAMMSEVAGTDLGPFFQSIGTHWQEVSTPTPTPVSTGTPTATPTTAPTPTRTTTPNITPTQTCPPTQAPREHPRLFLPFVLKDTPSTF